ncbi:MAG: endonuclease III [Lachnospiraceae bacterium]|nr:endonuclease III [Lachnospiraceae bacterium]
MTKKQRAEMITERLNEIYGTELVCYLEYEEPWQLLISTIMSAQCTDKRVNMVAKELYKKYPNIEALADANLSELEETIKSVGLYKSKAKNIISCAKDIVEKFDGKVPKTIEELTSLAGVGRKTANVIRGNVFKEASIVVDTHVKRVSRLLGLAKEEDPEKIEYELMKVLPKKQWILYNIQIIAHGRSICVARSPKCDLCKLKDLCLNHPKN